MHALIIMQCHSYCRNKSACINFVWPASPIIVMYINTTVPLIDTYTFLRLTKHKLDGEQRYVYTVTPIPRAGISSSEGTEEHATHVHGNASKHDDWIY